MDVLKQTEKVFLDLMSRQVRADEKVFLEDEKAWQAFEKESS